MYTQTGRVGANPNTPPGASLRGKFPDLPWVYQLLPFLRSWYITRLANVAQLVEQLIRNEQVSGSSPLIGSMSYFVSPGRLRRPGLTFFTFRTAPHHLLEVALKSAREYSPVAARAPVR